MPAVLQERQLPLTLPTPPLCWPRIDKANPDLITQLLPKMRPRAPSPSAEARTTLHISVSRDEAHAAGRWHRVGVLGERLCPQFLLGGEAIAPSEVSPFSLERTDRRKANAEGRGQCKGSFHNQKNTMPSKSFGSLLRLPPLVPKFQGFHLIN